MTIEAQIAAAWAAETSTHESWSPDNPAAGQCAVTALVVQDVYGGDLLRVVNEGESHYFNRLPDGREVDLTRGQFATWEPSDAELRDRDYVLSFAATAARYAELRVRIERERIARAIEAEVVRIRGSLAERSATPLLESAARIARAS